MDKVKRHDFCCNFLGKLAYDDTIMNKVFGDEAMFHMLDLTSMDFFLWGFVRDNVYAPRCRQHYTSSRHG
jgi:hypothetical protein